ncbi:MAG TPA: hypothetical protein PLX87_06275 [Bacteroidales bacterium]|nr:hypothetical protein [Bacteroidales bacterium]HOU31690.1 hypothetical protein [Bacteroidales bacterium]HPP92781.1 hypothetical protein [Bacteroidales bacterium]HQK70298.1 hypothetical protein [Bacteroidales bacterium]
MKIRINNNYLLSHFPPPDELLKIFSGKDLPEYREVNAHIHTPFSFSAFPGMEMIFSMATEENIKVLGINDFYVADGFEEFFKGCISNGIFPLFNIEFIGLMKECQQKGIRINDPNNPGRIYFSGKGLDYPFHLDTQLLAELSAVKEKTQEQLRQMLDKLNVLITRSATGLSLSFEEVKKRFARELVRERHLAKAVRILAAENFATQEEQLKFIETLYGGKKSKFDMSMPAALENEIRSNLLKAGGEAFVAEDEESFLEPEKIIKIIKSAGGIPCYPVLLDDARGNFTEFEKDYDSLYHSLISLNTGCIELIPGRNDHDILRDFAEFFYRKGFIITFGTEHNTPELEPLTVSARGHKELDPELKKISWKGACVIAAHQYLRAKGKEGYLITGEPDMEIRNRFEELGRCVIEYYLKNY